MIWYQALFSFQGRLNRQGFWLGVGINFLFICLFANFFRDPTAFTWISVLPLLIMLYSLSALIVKRLHDRGRSGKALFMVCVPILCYSASLVTQGIMAWLLGVMMPFFIGTILLLEWGVFAGETEPNQYGLKGVSIRFKS